MDWNRLRDERLAVIADLSARAPGGVLGRTAIMKLCYFLQVLKGVPLGYRFTLYSYGPFDSDVLSDLSTAESLGAVSSVVGYYPGGYGYKIQKSGGNEAVVNLGSHFLAQHRASIDWVLSEFGSLKSAELELQSTIIFVDREADRKSKDLELTRLASQVHDIKPHFSEPSILENVARLYQKGLLVSAKPAVVTATTATREQFHVCGEMA